MISIYKCCDYIVCKVIKDQQINIASDEIIVTTKKLFALLILNPIAPLSNEVCRKDISSIVMAMKKTQVSNPMPFNIIVITIREISCRVVRIMQTSILSLTLLSKKYWTNLKTKFVPSNGKSRVIQ